MHIHIHTCTYIHIHTQYSLYVDVGIVGGKQDIGNKVIFNSWVDLDNVAPLATNVQIVDGSTLKFCRSGTDGKRM